MQLGNLWSERGCTGKVRALDLKLPAKDVAFLEEPYQPHGLVEPLARPGEKPLAGTNSPLTGSGPQER